MSTIQLPDLHGGRTPSEHRDALYDAFARISDDCVTLGLRPCNIGVGGLFGQVDASVQFSGTDRDAVDALAEAYGFDPDDTTPHATIFTRAGSALIGEYMVKLRIFTGHPKGRMTLIREWVAQNYSDESKRLVAEGAEATPEDQAKFTRAEAAGLFSDVPA